MKRRTFLQRTSLAAGAFTAAPFVRAAEPAKLRTALIGSGWWCKNILKEAMASGRCKVVALVLPQVKMTPWSKKGAKNRCRKMLGTADWGIILANNTCAHEHRRDYTLPDEISRAE